MTSSVIRQPQEMMNPSTDDLTAAIMSADIHKVTSVSNLSDASGDLTVATEASADTSSSSSDSRRVSFGAIHIREYERIVGDHPDTRIGVPLSIGWAFYERQTVDLDSYEANRPRRKLNLRMSSITRKNLLHHVFEISEDEIRSAEKENQRIKKFQTKKQQKKAKGALQSLRRKVGKTLNAESFIKGLSAAASHGMMISMSHQ